jgi:hypothetical protein
VRYDSIQQLAFPIRPEQLAGILQPYQACTFPGSWKAAFADLLHPERTTGERGVPLRDLTTAFATFQPEVIVNSAAADGRLWLGAADKPDDGVLRALIHSGIATATHAWAKRYPHKGVHLDRLPDLLSRINPATDLRWETVSPVPAAGQTAGDATFRLLPDLLAAYIVGQGWTVDHGGVAVSRFQRIATSGGAELVSWPPHYHPNRTRRWPWSYVIRLTVQTLPADSTPYLFVHIGLRRYASPKVFLKNNDRALSVALKAPAPWYDGAMPGLFARATMQWRPGPYGKKEGRMDWTDDIVDVLQRYHGGFALPDPTKLCADPLKHIANLPGYEAGYESAVFYRTGYAYKHPVGDGVSAKDRWRLFSQLQDLLAPHLTAAGLTNRVHQVTVPARPAPKKDGIRIPTGQVAAAIGEQVTAEVWWQTTTMRDEILAALPRTLQMPDLVAGPADDTWRSANDDLSLTVYARELADADLAQKLDVDRSIFKKPDRMRDAASRRIAQIDDWLKPHPATGPTFTLVELDDADAFTDENDPKFATRTGAGRNGRNTQFLVPPNDKETAAARRIRIEQSIRELFVRQAGVPARRTKLGLDDQPLPEATRVVALWLIRKNTPQNSAYPVAVCCDPGQPVIKMRFPGDRTWYPMYQALLRLSTLRGDQALLNSNAVSAFIDDLLDQLGETDGPTLLVSHAQNMRGNWKTTTNTQLQLDNLGTVPGARVSPDRHPNIRFVRARTNLNAETTQHYAYGAREVVGADGATRSEHVIGISAGLWQPGSTHGRIFLSTPDKPPTASKSSPRGSRIERRTKKTKDGREVEILDISADVWNPQLVEFFVAAIQHGDSPASWAAAAHQYRYVAAHYDDPTLLPLPMHHGVRAGEYLLPGHQLDTKLATSAG